MRRIFLTVPLVAGVLLASACGGGYSSAPQIGRPTPGPSTTPSPSPRTSPTIAPTTPPTSTPSPPPTSTPTPTTAPTPTPTPLPTATPTPAATPQVIHIGFELAEKTDPLYGPVYFYSTVLGNSAQVIQAKAGSQVVFVNDDPIHTSHTASGLGTAFPKSFDNLSDFTQAGTKLDGSLTWSTGSLLPGQHSQVFTVGPPGLYYFGCGYHYTTKPTKTNGSMGDLVVST